MIVRAEWTKLRTTPGPAGLLLLTAIVTVALSLAVAAATRCPPAGCGLDPARLALSGVYLGQAPIAVLAVLSVGGEYSSTLIRTTLTAVPDRRAVLAAKALVLALPVAAVGGLSLLAALIIAGRRLPRLSLTDGLVLRAGAGSVAYLVLVAVLSLGIAAIVRDSAASIGAVMGLLYLPPIIIPMVAEPHLHRLLEQTAPMTAGLAVQATTDLGQLPIGPGAGLAVLAAWAAAALLTGTLLLHRRDT